MAFRSHRLARILASTAFIVSSLTVSVTTGALRVVQAAVEPRSQLFLALCAFSTMGVIFAVFGNQLPTYRPTMKYPGGRFVAPMVVCLLACAVISPWVLGGSPDLTVVDGHAAYRAFNHGTATPISATEYYWLVVALPLGFVAIQVHLLLENRWRYRKFLRETSQTG